MAVSSSLKLDIERDFKFGFRANLPPFFRINCLNFQINLLLEFRKKIFSSNNLVLLLFL